MNFLIPSTLIYKSYHYYVRWAPVNMMRAQIISFFHVCLFKLSFQRFNCVNLLFISRHSPRRCVQTHSKAASLSCFGVSLHTESPSCKVYDFVNNQKCCSQHWILFFLEPICAGSFTIRGFDCKHLIFNKMLTPGFVRQHLSALTSNSSCL